MFPRPTSRQTSPSQEECTSKCVGPASCLVECGTMPSPRETADVDMDKQDVELVGEQVGGFTGTALEEATPCPTSQIQQGQEAVREPLETTRQRSQ
ncbi:unnamed protein product, partial [Amoebophrya sp. A25]|eukprot:GSA25T00021954001.1